MSQEPKLLTEFFARNGGSPQEEFLETYKGAFLLGRYKNSPPYLLFVGMNPEEGVIIGCDEGVDFDVDDPTLDSEHAKIAYHEGFKGWTITDTGTSFGTHLDGARIAADRPVLIPDGGVIKPGGGLTELQFYNAETLYSRMSKAGITRSLRRKGSALAGDAKQKKPDSPIE